MHDPCMLHASVHACPTKQHRDAHPCRLSRLQLDSLPWEKVDVDVRDFHAHAAIVCRTPWRFQHCRDVLDFVADTFARWPPSGSEAGKGEGKGSAAGGLGKGEGEAV